MVLRLILALVFGFLLLNCGVPQQTSVINVPDPSPTMAPTPERSIPIDFHIKSIRLGDTEKQVLDALGKPNQRRVLTVDNCGITKILKLSYPGLEVQLDRDLDDKWFVLEMIVTSPEIPIEPKVSIGDDFDSVQKSFAKPNVERSDNGDLRLYFVTKTNDNAQFEFKNNKLSRVRFYVNPC